MIRNVGLLIGRSSLYLALAVLPAIALVAGETTIAIAPGEPPAPPLPANDSGKAGFLVSPPVVMLQGNFDRVQLVVTERDAAGHVHATSRDLTRSASFTTDNAKIASVDTAGQVVARSNGQAMLRVQVGAKVWQVPVVVRSVKAQPEIDFHLQVAPILSKAGCNMGACHAAQHGQGGLKLSVFGFAPGDDWSAMVRDRWQRRVSFLRPEDSLILRKPTMQVPHGGGRRLVADSLDYQVLKAWIAADAPGPSDKSPRVTKIKVTPWQRVGAVGLEQQLRVEAMLTGGTTRDVTHWAKFDTMDDAVLEVTERGQVRVIGKGQANVLVRYEGQAEIATFVIPYSGESALPGWESNNFVDELAAAKFRELGIQPAPLSSDATFMRRAYLDATGTTPRSEEVLQFIASDDPQKREKLVDRLLGLTGDPALDIYNDKYAAYWTLKWSDLLRNNSNSVGEQGMWALHNWIREAFRVNKPFDEFVTELVTAKGSIYSNGPANYFRIHRNSTELTEATAQIFLGVRMECAKCHHHPFEKYSQADYYGLAAFFSRVGTKNSEEFGLFGREQIVLVKSSGEVSHPKTRQVMPPTPLGEEPTDHPLDRRVALAEWLTSAENQLFARAMVNRYVSYLLGRGLVEPVDDMRETNPPSNEALMDALAKHLVASEFDLKQLLRTIMVSRLYQLQSVPTETSSPDGRYYSFYQVKRLAAEPLLDAIDAATGTQTKFQNLPPGTKAIELPDAEYPNYFLNTFAKPRRVSVCECERSPDENLAQALHTLNGDLLMGKIADASGRVASLLKAKKTHEQIVRELYLCTLCRRPTEAELAASDEFLKLSGSPQECYEDLLWALINSKQFLFVH